jgi:hypothetical protein
MSATQQTLSQLIRAKFPGAYDDMDDSTLEQNVLAKHPEYSDLPRTPAQTSQQVAAAAGPAQKLSPAPQRFTMPWLKGLFYNQIADPTLNALPAAGATAGGIIGASGGTLGAPGPGSVIGGTGGAGIGGMAGAAARQLGRRALGFESPATSNDAAKDIVQQGGLQSFLQLLTGGTAAGARALAPEAAESSLGITQAMRGRGRTIGQAVINETQGVRPQTIMQQSQQRISSITQQMEDAVHAATQQGATGSTQPAHDVLNSALNNLPRNARSVSDRLAGLRDLLDLTPVPSGQARRMIHTPDELLEIKRGIGTEISTWPPEWQKLPVVKQTQQQIYGAIDSELDRLVPDNAAKNQLISSLIPAKQAAQKLTNAAPLAQRLAHRAAAHTGALAGSGIGGFLGSQEGATPEERRRNTMLGAAAGFVLPEMLTTPTAQMSGARLLNVFGKNPEYVLPWMRAGIASQQQGKKQNNAQKQ